MSGRIVVIGVGNAWRRDDGAGLAVARRVAADPPDGVEVVELDGEPARVVEAWAGAALALLVDAVRTGAPPGTVGVLDPEVVPTRGSSTHALGPAEAYRLGTALGRLPDRLVVVGIEVTDVSDGTGLSAPVAAAVDRAADAVRAAISARAGTA